MIKFLIQKIDGKVVHDFSFTLLESVRFHNWLVRSNDYRVSYYNTKNGENKFIFKIKHVNYIPIGSVEFVTQHLQIFHDITAKPRNVPEELFTFANRDIVNSNNISINNKGLKMLNTDGKYFIKSNDKIKDFSELIDTSKPFSIPIGNYQISKFVDIDSEWRAFVYDRKLVGLQNYSGEFTIFPNSHIIKDMIRNYCNAPIAYTLDVGVNNITTFVIECHDFFSCSHYGFANHAIIGQMYYKWYNEYVKNNR